MGSVFLINEEHMFNLEGFCDSKYNDPNCRKYGFFKVKFDASCAGQCSSMQEFFRQFGVPGQSKIRQGVLVSNPNDKNLFGLRNIQATASQKHDFMSTSYDPASFQEVGVSPNCCLSVLQEQGEDAFLQHFYAEVTSNPMLKSSNINKDLACIRKRAVTKKIAFKKRQSFQMASSMEGKKRALEMAMLSEKVLECPYSQCLCDSCDLEYCVKQGAKCQNNKKGGGLLYSAGIEESANNYLHLTKNFAMAHLCFKNMLADLDSLYGGVSYPALYLGGLHTLFPLHTEDLSTWSFNFNLHGYPKFWLIVPPTSVSQVTDALHRRGFYGVHRWCRNALIHKFYVPTVDFLKEENIPFQLVIQWEGEGIIVFPNAAHTGGNLGPNLAEACNFGTEKWIPYGCVSPNCPCMEDTVHADLTDVVAVHKPDMLKAYLSNNIRNIAEDPYFLQSIVVPKSDLLQHKVANHDNSVVSSSLSAERRVKCPVCDVSWAYFQKSNILTHLKKYHSSRMKEGIVTQFMDLYLPSIK